MSYPASTGPWPNVFLKLGSSADVYSTLKLYRLLYNFNFSNTSVSRVYYDWEDEVDNNTPTKYLTIMYMCNVKQIVYHFWTA